ncbi:MAG TPA: hypothetical protein VG605_00140 [Puia sp.]|nr:hypothetical protein [Puia sp.]
MKLSSSIYGTLSIYGPLLLSITAITACRSSRESRTDTTPTATWQQQPLTVDGSDKDWTRPLPGHSKSDNLDYEIANDGQNLYVLVSTKDQLEMQKIIQGGMTVWVNTKSDKSQAGAIGIGYPLDSRNDRDRSLMEEAQPDRYKQPRAVTLEDKKDYALYGFGKESEVGNYTYGDDNPQGVKMRMDYNNGGELIYEASIPLATLYPGHNAGSSYAAKSVAVGIFVDALPPNANVPPGAGGGGGPAIGVDGGLGFGSFGSGGGIGLSIGLPIGGGGGGRRGKQLFRDSEIWQVVQLSNMKRGF